jgi:hypothetical protein
MIANLAVAALLNVVTFLIHAVGLIGLTHSTAWLVAHPLCRGRAWEKIAALSLLSFGLFAVISVELAVWAVALVFLGAFTDMATAFYYSASAFATIGFGDVMPGRDWHLLGAMEGLTGFLIVGWTAAYLVTSGIRFGPFRRDHHF